MAESEDMARITVRVPVEARDRVYKWAEELGVRTGHFASMALMLGAERLMYQHRVMLDVTCSFPGCDRPCTYHSAREVGPDGKVWVWCEFHEEEGHDLLVVIDWESYQANQKLEA